jgi:hypothetical protein
MAMTKKDYELIAGALSLAKHCVQESGLYTPELAVDLATTIIADQIALVNSNFDYYKFLEKGKSDAS